MTDAPGQPGTSALGEPPPHTPQSNAGRSRAVLRSARNAIGSRRGVVARNGLLSMTGLVVLGGSRVVWGAMVSHATDRATFGLVGALTAITMISSYILPAGLGSAISRFIPFSRGRGDPSAARGLYRVLARTAFAGASVLSVVAAAIALQTDAPAKAVR